MAHQLPQRFRATVLPLQRTGPNGRVARTLAALDRAAVRYSAAPGVVLAWLLAANAVLAAAGVAAGLVLFDDPALYFRELMPGTLLSAAHLLAAATVARAIHLRDVRERRWPESFWGLSAVLLVGLVIVELAQPTVYLSHWLRDGLGLRAPAGIADLDGLLMAFLLGAVTLMLASRAREVFRHPRAVALFGCAAALGATSQYIDATFRVSAWEFVLEDGAKALAGPFLVTGYLVVLGAVLQRRPS